MNQRPSEFNPEYVRMHAFRVVKAEIDTPMDYTGDPDGEFSYKVHYESGYRLDDNLMRTNIEVHIEFPSENPAEQDATAYFQISYYFEVMNLRDLVTLKKKHAPVVDDALQVSMASVAYSTTRGVLMTRLENTALRGFFLPVISPETLINTTPIRL